MKKSRHVLKSLSLCNQVLSYLSAPPPPLSPSLSPLSLPPLSPALSLSAPLSLPPLSQPLSLSAPLSLPPLSQPLSLSAPLSLPPLSQPLSLSAPLSLPPSLSTLTLPSLSPPSICLSQGPRQLLVSGSSLKRCLYFGADSAVHDTNFLSTEPTSVKSVRQNNTLEGIAEHRITRIK